MLLLSGYDATSHRYWRKLLASKLCEFDWTQVALPDRYFSWRVRGNSLTFAFQHRSILMQQYDVLIVTSMVDLANLRGLLPHLADIPTLVYFHENQFEFPTNSKNSYNSNAVNAQLTSIYTLLAADQVLFNSAFNKKTFFAGANRLFKKLPDGIEKGILKKAEISSKVIPVPIAKNYYRTNKLTFSEPVEIVWNHRWEFDKQPAVFFNALAKLKRQGIAFKLHVMGQSFRQVPECFEEAQSLFKDEIVSWGFQTKDKYQAVLSSADLVISTALHDFQGLSMLEAIASGCYPIAPNRVAYPEYMTSKHLYSVSGSEEESESLYNKLVQWFNDANLKPGLKLNLKESVGESLPNNHINEYCCRKLLPEYQIIIQRLADKQPQEV